MIINAICFDMLFSMDGVLADSRLSADAAVFEPRKLAEMPEVPTDRVCTVP